MSIDCNLFQFLDPVRAGQPTRVEVTFTNRLNVHMTNITYSVNGKGLTWTLREQRYLISLRIRFTSSR